MIKHEYNELMEDISYKELITGLQNVATATVGMFEDTGKALHDGELMTVFSDAVNRVRAEAKEKNNA